MSSEEDKLAKQKAFLAPYLERINVTLVFGMEVLRFMKTEGVDALESELIKCREVIEKIPSKKELKMAMETMEDTTNYMIHLFNQGFLSDNTDFDDQFEPEIDMAQQKYSEKLAKALEARQKHAPGFDGQGGGIGRRG